MIQISLFCIQFEYWFIEILHSSQLFAFFSFLCTNCNLVLLLIVGYSTRSPYLRIFFLTILSLVQRVHHALINYQFFNSFSFLILFHFDTFSISFSFIRYSIRPVCLEHSPKSLHFLLFSFDLLYRLFVFRYRTLLHSKRKFLWDFFLIIRLILLEVKGLFFRLNNILAWQFRCSF